VDGSATCRRDGYPIDDKLDWTVKNARHVAHTFAHTIDIAETMIGFELACRETGAARLIDHHQLLPSLPEATRSLADPFAFRLSIPVKDLARTMPRVARGLRDSLAVSVVPDRVFSLIYPDSSRHNFCLEQDRGTMDIKSRSLTAKANVRKKLVGYFHAWKQGLHTQLWGFQGFRVLITTTSETRIANMLDVQREITGDTAANLFLYSTHKRLAERGTFGDAWISAKSDAVSILPATKE
jgi:hypothetical protein